MAPSSLLMALLALVMVQPCEANVWTNGLIYLPIYLGIATIANIFMAWQCYKAVRLGYNSESTGLVILMLSGIAWCVPCFVQCIGTAIEGDFWGGDVGCDVMGFYSAFATYSSQMATLLMAGLTYLIIFAAVPAWTRVALVGVVIFILSGLISMLPLVGVGEYVKYEGFCYIDYRQTTQVVLWLVCAVPCVLGVLGIYLFIYKRSLLPKIIRLGLLGFWFCFFCGWVLGIPLIILGLSNSTYPDGLNLTSGILGHLQNLINPFLYGFFWYKWFIAQRVVPKTFDGGYPTIDLPGYQGPPIMQQVLYNTPATPAFAPAPGPYPYAIDPVSVGPYPLLATQWK